MSSVSLESTVAGIKLETCVYNASGPRTGSSAQLGKICQSESGAILTKSATVSSQNGNPQPRTWHSDESLAHMNSEGLPNSGIDYYISESTINETFDGQQTKNKKPYMVSISGKTLADNLKMLQLIHERQESGADIAAVELNLACPNVIGKPIIGYDFEQFEQVLSEVSKFLSGKKMVLGVKMPPYFDSPHFQNAASILNKYKDSIKYVACINTIGNSLAVDIHAEMPAISSNGGFAGLSGPCVKYTALANVKKFRSLLVDEIDVIGVGGIQSGQDVFEMILCGASAVQIGTCHWVEGPKCFDRICDELRALMKSKGYTSIGDFKGKLKEWSRDGASISRAAKKKEKSAKEENQIKEGKKTSPNVLYIVVAGVVLAIAGNHLTEDTTASAHMLLSFIFGVTACILSQ